MVWYGMIWYGMVWYGMVWYGVVWCGRHGIVWYNMVCNISNLTTRTELHFKSVQFDQVRSEAEDWIKMRGLEI